MDENTLLLSSSAEEATGALLFDLHPSRCGDVCPSCGRGKLDYNGLLELECPSCGYRNGGDGGGCT